MGRRIRQTSLVSQKAHRAGRRAFPRDGGGDGHQVGHRGSRRESRRVQEGRKSNVQAKKVQIRRYFLHGRDSGESRASRSTITTTTTNTQTQTTTTHKHKQQQRRSSAYVAFDDFHGK